MNDATINLRNQVIYSIAEGFGVLAEGSTEAAREHFRRAVFFAALLKASERHQADLLPPTAGADDDGDLRAITP